MKTLILPHSIMSHFTKNWTIFLPKKKRNKKKKSASATSAEADENDDNNDESPVANGNVSATPTVEVVPAIDADGFESVAPKKKKKRFD